MGLQESLRLYTQLALIRWKAGSPRDYRRTWDSFWSSVQRTGEGGQVLWDSLPEQAAASDLLRFKAHLDDSLPLLDLGCGNGRQTRHLARSFRRVIGVDVSPAAVELARRETGAEGNTEYRVLDATLPAEARALRDEIGECNIYMRGVLHVIQPSDRRRFVETLEILLGSRGTLYLIELGHGTLAVLRRLRGSSPSGLPALVHEVVQHGARPFGFDLDEQDRCFPTDRWTALDQGDDVAISTVPHAEDGQVSLLPASYLVLRNARVRPAWSRSRAGTA
jgi:SAM-dependent methyltransferase